MTILVTGATGRIGSAVIDHLVAEGAAVRALTRAPEKAHFPSGVEALRGDPADIDAMRAALTGVDTLFLLVANVPDELTQAITTLSLARDAGVRGIVYLSVFKSEAYVDAPHFTGKHAVERMIAALDLPATVLRPSYFMQNDLAQKEALLAAGTFAVPLGQVGISMVDVRDIAEAAAIALLRRERAPGRLPAETYDVVGPDALTGDALAKIWAQALGRAVRYGGDDLDGMEQRLRGFAPAWLAYDLRVMMRRYQEDGAVATEAEVERFADLLGRRPRSYRDFAAEVARNWRGV
ncbi:NmrA family transcriptional regulator [Methylobacterium radiotolerans]|uniref:NmrA family NAD(P)-binding protein n=1 Tax=Methylobacterium TaxID=407 RepID=UPI002F312CA2